MIKIKNRNQYDIIYECLVHCLEYENSITFPNTKSRFTGILGGNSKIAGKMVSNILLKSNLIEINPDIEHYRDVYKITEKGQRYIECYEELKGLLVE